VNDDARRCIEALGLAPHPEGGFYRETYRSPMAVAAPHGTRAASTAIYFLLPAGALSALHRVRSDEVWHHYAGDPLDLHLIEEPARHSTIRLGSDLAAGELPQYAVSSGIWQAAAVASGGRYALCGCTVAPGFDFADFELPSRAELVERMPALREWVERLTKA
jgi:predicted cupin superfamily sugar epimerase